MANPEKKDKDSGKTPFQKFEKLARKVANVPKEKAKEDNSQPDSS